MRKGQAGQLSATHFLTSSAEPPQQSIQRRRRAASGVIGTCPSALSSSGFSFRGSRATDSLPDLASRPSAISGGLAISWEAGVVKNVTAGADGRDVADAGDPQRSAPKLPCDPEARGPSRQLREDHMVRGACFSRFKNGCLPMELCRDWQFSGVLKQPPKLRLRSEAHGSIRVQEGEPNLRRAVGDTAGGLSLFNRKRRFGKKIKRLA